MTEKDREGEKDRGSHILLDLNIQQFDEEFRLGMKKVSVPLPPLSALWSCIAEIMLNAHTLLSANNKSTLRSLARAKVSSHTVSNGSWSHVSAHI